MIFKGLIIPLRFVTKWNLRIGPVRACVRACVRGQISGTTRWIFLILGMMIDLYAPLMPVI